MAAPGNGVPPGFLRFKGRAYPNGNDMACGQQHTVNDLADFCRRSPECLGFSTKAGAPHCAKSRLGGPVPSAGEDFYLNQTAIQYARIPSEGHADIITDMCDKVEQVRVDSRHTADGRRALVGR